MAKGSPDKEPQGLPGQTPPPFNPPAKSGSWSPTKKAGGTSLGASLVRGGALAPRNLAERFKSLKRRDLIFILSGLAVLVMAPLAEYLITSPQDDPSLREGFDRKGPLFPDAAGIYEDGVGGISPGGPPGQETDVITPLNVRDPTSLIHGPGQSQEKPATPSTSPKKDEGWNDAIATAAGQGAKTAVQKTPGLPRPNPKMTGALKDAFAGLAGASRGGGPSLTLPPPQASGLAGRPRVASALTRTQALPGLRGGGRSLAQGAGGGSPFNRGGSGAPGGAADLINPGGVSGGGAGPGGGRPGDGSETRNPGGNSSKDNKNLSVGESLAFLAAKENLLKAIALKWDKRRYDELERKKMLEQMAAQTASQALLKILDKLLEKPKGGDGGKGGGDKGGGGAPGGKSDPGKADPSNTARPLPPDANRPRADRLGPHTPNERAAGKPAIPAMRITLANMELFYRALGGAGACSPAAGAPPASPITTPIKTYHTGLASSTDPWMKDTFAPIVGAMMTGSRGSGGTGGAGAGATPGLNAQIKDICESYDLLKTYLTSADQAPAWFNTQLQQALEYANPLLTKHEAVVPDLRGIESETTGMRPGTDTAEPAPATPLITSLPTHITDVTRLSSDLDTKKTDVDSAVSDVPSGIAHVTGTKTQLLAQTAALLQAITTSRDSASRTLNENVSRLGEGASASRDGFAAMMNQAGEAGAVVHALAAVIGEDAVAAAEATKTAAEKSQVAYTALHRLHEAAVKPAGPKGAYLVIRDNNQQFVRTTGTNWIEWNAGGARRTAANTAAGELKREASAAAGTLTPLIGPPRAGYADALAALGPEGTPPSGTPPATR